MGREVNNLTLGGGIYSIMEGVSDSRNADDEAVSRNNGNN